MVAQYGREWTEDVAEVKKLLIPHIKIGDEKKADRDNAKKRFHIIEKAQDWIQIEVDFITEAEATGLMTIDVENLNPKHAKRLSSQNGTDYTARGMGTVWVLAANGHGRALAFDIRRMRRNKGEGAKRMDFAELIPKWLWNLCGDENILKVGSNIFDDIKKDFSPVGVRVEPAADILWAMAKAADKIFGTGAYKGRPGLGGICEIMYGFDYKPTEARKPNPNRSYALYDWPHNYNNYHLSYLRNDCVVPIALALAAAEALAPEKDNLKEAVFKAFSGWIVWDAVDYANSTDDFSQPPAAISCQSNLEWEGVEDDVGEWWTSDNNNDPEWETVDQCGSTDEFGKDFKIVENSVYNNEEGDDMEIEIDDVIAMEVKGNGAATLTTEHIDNTKCIELWEVDADTEEVLEVTPIPINTFNRWEHPDLFPDHQLCPETIDNVRQFPMGDGWEKRQKFKTIKKTAKERNAKRDARQKKLATPMKAKARHIPVQYRKRFTPGSRCFFCGHTHHARVDCKKWKAHKAKKLARACAYELCTRPEGHLIYICPDLHGRCFGCENRGHGSKICEKDGSNQEILRATFERWAFGGWLTAQRKKWLPCGYYNIKQMDWLDGTKKSREKPESEFGTDYFELVQKPTEVAQGMTDVHNKKVMGALARELDVE